MKQARVRLWPAAALGLTLGLAFGWTMPARGQEPPPTEPAVRPNNTPKAPPVKAEHKGRLLVLSYGAKGSTPQASAETRGEPPAFVIYRGQRQIAAGQFEYG